MLTHRFAPGERLVEDRLAATFGVSRNPVREAIRMLAAEGLVEVTARRGATVARLSPEEAQELVEVRAMLEGANARLAARRHDPLVLARLHDILARGAAAVEAGAIERVPPLNDEFHALLADAGRNRVLADLMKTLRDRTSPLFRRSDAAIERESWAEHAAILRAVLDGDAEVAAALAYRHVIHAGRMRGIVAGSEGDG